MSELSKCMEKLSQVLAKDSQGDLIYRADAIDACVRVRELHAYDEIEEIEKIPSARPTGEWVDTTSGEHYKCSLCGCRASYFCIDTNRAIEWFSEYCPNCGARMKGTDNE